MPLAAVAILSLQIGPVPGPAADPSPCGGNLRALWQRMQLYPSQFGGRLKTMPAETGPDFWLKLVRVNPPLLAAKEQALLFCPGTKETPRPEATSYRGPLGLFARLQPGDPVGSCEPDAHPDRSIVVLLKSGETRKVPPGDPLYAAALEKTRGNPGRAGNPPPDVRRGLRTILSAQADFRANDRDSNGLLDFWVGDISGLRRVMPVPGKPANLIEADVAAADAAPIAADGFEKPAAGPPVPYGGYLFVALKVRREGGKMLPLDEKNGRNPFWFGVAAYPADGKGPTYVAGPTNTLHRRELGGKPPEALPDAAELERDWPKVD